MPRSSANMLYCAHQEECTRVWPRQSIMHVCWTAPVNFSGSRGKAGLIKRLSAHAFCICRIYAKSKWKAFKSRGVGSDTMRCREGDLSDIIHLFLLCACWRLIYKCINTIFSIIKFLSSLSAHELGTRTRFCHSFLVEVAGARHQYSLTVGQTEAC